ARRLLATDAREHAQALFELGRAQLEVLGHVVDDLGPVVRGGSRPRRALDGGLDRVADVLAVAEGSLAEALARSPDDGVAVVAVRALLLAADVELGRAVDARSAIGGGAGRSATWLLVGEVVVAQRTEQLGSGGISQVVVRVATQRGLVR